MEGYAVTNIGRVRETNQDYSFCSCRSVGKLENLFLVADGMGGHNAGDYASAFTVNEIVSYVYGSSEDAPVKVLKEAIDRANRKLYERCRGNAILDGAGTTLVAATVSEDTLYVGNIGDSRLYLYRQDTLKQITKDHSLVDELVSLGRMEPGSPEYISHKNVITRAVGTREEVETDFFEVEIRPRDLILICTDGLTGMVDDARISTILGNKTITLEDKAKLLVEMANQNGGYDNITILLAENN